MTFLQGDIVLVQFPFSDHQDSKYRPAMVVSGPKVNRTSEVILAPITTTIKNDEFSFNLDSKITHSLNTQSELRCHKLFITEKSIIKKKISALKPGHYAEIFEKIIENFK